MSPIRKTAKRVENFVVYRILHVDDTPHRLALGLALGIFVAWTPTIGLQMILVLLLAPLIRANGRVGVPMVWISNPLTIALIYYPNYLVGYFIMGSFAERASPGHSFQQIQEQLGNIQQSGHFFSIAFWQEVGRLVLDIGVVDLIVGSIVVGLVLGLVMYIVSYRFIVWYRTHNPIFRRLYRLRRKSEKQRESSPD
ncbi:MAG: DUF2062 domain-containing protein, partial [Sedimentisphaerales bacterium]|nr:DUF2062 domain-containing protein [Sedimentisphaerales bacterium]